MLADQKTLTQEPRSMQTKTQYITPDRAFAHIAAQEPAVRRVLAHTKYIGTYVLQAGFSEERLFQQLRAEEVYVSLEVRVSKKVAKNLLALFGPFYGAVFTPGMTYYRDAEPMREDIVEVFPGDGVGEVVGAGKKIGLLGRPQLVSMPFTSTVSSKD